MDIGGDVIHQGPYPSRVKVDDEARHMMMTHFAHFI
uniref:Uncharacterized protein n=1 Tax=Anguilla anguilla TaxID=7936 RepID=A0A0E9UWC0_ANGAN